jgi:hypothetical protein
MIITGSKVSAAATHERQHKVRVGLRGCGSVCKLHAIRVVAPRDMGVAPSL